MKVCRLKIDPKGRVQFPKSFLDANDISHGQWGFIEIINSNSRAIRFTFESREEMENRHANL